MERLAQATNIANIGCSGRNKKDAGIPVYDGMKTHALQLIIKECGVALCNVHLLSWGSSWADHIAVDLHHKQMVDMLTLYLPGKGMAQLGNCMPIFQKDVGGNTHYQK